MNKIIRQPVGADLSAFREGSAIQMYVLNIIILIVHNKEKE
jgi:hypothetical protein